jgi:hypothetical protein
MIGGSGGDQGGIAVDTAMIAGVGGDGGLGEGGEARTQHGGRQAYAGHPGCTGAGTTLIAAQNADQGHIPTD